MSKQKIIFYELNEVPYFIMDEHVRKFPKSPLAKILAASYQFETYTADHCHLSPWVTWPTVHRGVNDEAHCIYDFNQDLSEIDKAYPPLWSILNRNNINTGVFGSLHSSLTSDALNDYSFYIPDVFAIESKTYPSSFEPFQAFNLSMSCKSARNVSNETSINSALNVFAALKKAGITGSTYLELFRQLTHEKLNPARKNRRRTTQSILAFDAFYKCLANHKPDFCCFFTNHVASAMHRFWAASYPDQYEEFDLSNEWILKNKNEIDFAMKKNDVFLARLLKFIDLNPEFTLWITGSMGQSANEALTVDTEIYVVDEEKFRRFLKIPGKTFKKLPSMFPQFNFSVLEGLQTTIRNKLKCITIDGEPLIFREAKQFFSIDFGHKNLSKKIQHIMVGDKEFLLSDAGLAHVDIQEGCAQTGYHIPNGSLVIYDSLRQKLDQSRTQISTLDIAPLILDQFNINKPEYMSGKSFAY